MMAALLLMFVLALCYSMYQYFVMMETKTIELDKRDAQLTSQQTLLDDQTAKLALQQETLKIQEDALAAAQTSLQDQQGQLTSQQLTLDEQQRLLSAAQDELKNKAEELASTQLQLADQKNRLDAATSLLDAQKDTLDAQQVKIDDLIGLRTRIIQDLSGTLSSAKVKATVDKQSGDITLDSAVFFDTGKSTIKQSGKAFLDQFIPVYLGVLLRPEYENYLGEIVIEGHTDTQGSYLMNLELSQERALTVATYCLQMNGLTQEQRDYLQKILTAKGKSYSSPILNADGSINMEQSRRVEFQFRLKDAEMIDEMNRILSGE
jgi:chemotaxis protein MotB